MNRKNLADEIRGAGFAVRYADGPVIGGMWGDDDDFEALESPASKLETPDWTVIRRASTCSECEAVASKVDIELAEAWADCYQSFARLIWPCIDHEPECEAEPYLPVSEKASKVFKQLKAKFQAKRKEMWAELEAKAKKSRTKKVSKKAANKKITKKVTKKKKKKK